MVGAETARRLVRTATLVIVGGAATGGALAQAPTAAESLEAAERRLSEAKAERRREAAAAAADAERLQAALTEAKRRRDEALRRREALSATVREQRAESEAARRRESEAANLRARLEKALASGAEAWLGPVGAAPEKAGDAVVRETGAPLLRRLTALFHATDRARPGVERVVAERVVREGRSGRTLVVGALASYFVPDDGTPCRFLVSGAIVPPAYDAAVRAAADVAEKKAPPQILRLPKETAR